MIPVNRIAGLQNKISCKEAEEKDVLMPGVII